MEGLANPTMCVARPVAREEYTKSPEAMQAYWKEWLNMENVGVWNWNSLCEWDEVAADAKAKNEEVHFGYLFGIMVEKGSEHPVGDVRRYYKYRVVFQGSMVKDQNWEVALFNEMASTPATLEASRISDIYSCLPKHGVDSRDVFMAYLQAKMKGTPTYIMLPTL